MKKAMFVSRFTRKKRIFFYCWYARQVQLLFDVQYFPNAGNNSIASLEFNQCCISGEEHMLTKNKPAKIFYSAALSLFLSLAHAIFLVIQSYSLFFSSPFIVPKFVVYKTYVIY